MFLKVSISKKPKKYIQLEVNNFSGKLFIMTTFGDKADYFYPCYSLQAGLDIQ